MREGFNLIGYATSPSGLGEDLRSFASILEYLKISFSVIDIKTIASNSVKSKWNGLKNCDFKINIFFMSPMESLDLYNNYPNMFNKNYFNIGYFPWELPDYPQSHIKALEIVDCIWTPSRFCQNSLQGSTKKPVLFMPLPVIFHDGSGLDFRGMLDIPDDAHVSLYSFDIHSTLNRKNPQAVIESFCKFNAATPNTYLILKINRIKNSPLSDFEWLPNNKNIKAITHQLTQNELADLYLSANCYISLHRSEGFGRTLVEAMQHGLNIISTNFSGPNDFLTNENSYLVNWDKKVVATGDYPFTEGSWWANPSTNHAAELLNKSMVEPHISKNKIQETGNQYRPEVMAKNYQKFIEFLERKL